MRDFEEVKAEVEKLEEKHDKILKDYSDKHAAAQEREAAAIEAAEKAYKKTKVEEYHAAQEEARINRDAIQMYAAKIEEVKKEPIITKAKFKELREDIAEHLGGIVAEDKESLRDLIIELIELKEREEEALREGNGLIEHIQKDLLKEPCGIICENGTYIPQPNLIKRFRDYSIVEFLNFVTSHPLVNELAGDRLKHKEIKYWGPQ